ncbi:hypothetical protein SprV_0902784300 [Sparganum proliferum]
MCQQPDNVYFSHSCPCYKPRVDRHHRSHFPCLAAINRDTIRPAPTPASITASSSTNTKTPRTPPTGDAMSDVPSPSAITKNTSTSTNEDSAPTCPRCDRTFASHIDLVGPFGVHRTATDDSVPG